MSSSFVKSNLPAVAAVATLLAFHRVPPPWNRKVKVRTMAPEPGSLVFELEYVIAKPGSLFDVRYLLKEGRFLVAATSEVAEGHVAEYLQDELTIALDWATCEFKEWMAGRETQGDAAGNFALAGALCLMCSERLKLAPHYEEHNAAKVSSVGVIGESWHGSVDAAPGNPYGIWSAPVTSFGKNWATYEILDKSDIRPLLRLCAS